MILGIICNNCPKFKVYLVSKSCVMISFRISSKVLYVVTCSRVTSCWFTSWVWLFSIGWAIVVLLGNLTQLLYSGSSLVVVGCLSIPPCCNCITVSMNEYRRCFFHCQFSIPLALINSLFFQHLLLWLLTMISNSSYHIDWYIVSFRCFRCCCSIATNKFNFEHVLYFNLFGTFSKSMLYTITNYIGISNKYSNQFSRLCFIFARGFVDLIMAVGTIGTSFFLLW